jgi:hypothetical protein
MGHPWATGFEWVRPFSKEISEMVGQTCEFASNPGRDSPPFRKFLLRNNIAFEENRSFYEIAAPLFTRPFGI